MFLQQVMKQLQFFEKMPINPQLYQMG